MAQLLTNDPQERQALQRILPISQRTSQALLKAPRLVPAGGHVEGPEMQRNRNSSRTREGSPGRGCRSLEPGHTVGIRFQQRLLAHFILLPTSLLPSPPTSSPTTHVGTEDGAEAQTDHPRWPRMSLSFSLVFLFSGVGEGLEVEPGALHISGKCSTPEHNPQPTGTVPWGAV